MRVEQIRIGGVLRFTDAVTVDLSQLPPGLIALVGANGEGKSTLLEAPIAALYRQFPTRAGPGQSLVDYALGPDSFIETVFSVDAGTTYRARVALNGVQRKSEAVLTREVNGVPEVLTDGKVSSFDTYVRAHFPPLEVLLASAFAAQNRRGSFAILDRKDRKTLFAALLGLERYETMAQTARTAVGLVDRAIDRVSTERAVLARETTAEARAALHREWNQLQVASSQAEVRRVELQGQLQGLEDDVARLQEAVTAHEAAQATLATVLAHATRNTSEVDQIGTDQHACDRALDDELDRVRGREARDVADIETRRTNNQRVLEHRTEIRCAVEEWAERDAASDSLRAEHQQALEQLDTLRGSERSALQRDHERQQLEALIARGREDAAVLEQVPCQSRPPYDRCRFLTQARLTESSLDQRETQRAGMGDTAGDVDAIRSEITQLEAAATGLREDLARHEQALALIEPWFKQAGPLNDAERRLAELDVDQARITQNAVEQRETATTQHQTRSAALATRLVTVRAQVADLEQQATAAEETVTETASAHDDAHCQGGPPTCGTDRVGHRHGHPRAGRHCPGGPRAAPHGLRRPGAGAAGSGLQTPDLPTAAGPLAVLRQGLRSGRAPGP